MEGVRGAFRPPIRVLDKHVIVQLGGVEALQVVVHQVARLCPIIRPFPLHAQFVREQVKSPARNKSDIQSKLLNPNLPAHHWRVGKAHGTDIIVIMKIVLLLTKVMSIEPPAESILFVQLQDLIVNIKTVFCFQMIED